MDDLDHSMHIAEFDWTSFYDESEECSLLQPSLAWPDHAGLSDAEDSGNSSPVFITGRQELLQPSADTNHEEAERGNDALHDARTIREIGHDAPEGSAAIPEEINDDVTVQPDQIRAQSSESNAGGDFLQEPDPLSRNQTALPSSAVALRAEKERWFVTVNDGPVRRRVREKRKQKKSQRESETWRRIFDEDNECDADEILDKSGTADSSQTSWTSAEEDESSSESPVMPPPPRETLSLHDTFPTKRPLRFDSVESEDGAEFFSTHSNDSESYLSADESMEEALVEEGEPPRSSSSCRLDVHENTTAEDAQVGDTCPCESPHCPTEASVTSEDHESSEILTSLPENQTDPKILDEVREGADDVLISPDINPHAPGDRPSLRSVPDLTVTPCSVVDSPETFIAPARNTRPVYAISHFWDEMEKLTINDILQLRIVGSAQTRATPPAETLTVEDFPDHPRGLSLSNCGSTDTSDTADSDYFTQMDESKPERSSCEFSTSDFEEEYWQFMDPGGTASPDPQSENQPGTCESPNIEEEFTCSEGKETPVPSGDVVWDGLDIQEALAWTRQITRTKSVRDVPALTAEDLSLQVSLSSDGLCLASCPSMEANVDFEDADSLGTLIPAPFVQPQISFPEEFGSLLKGPTKRDSCVRLYDPQDSALAPVFDFSIGSFMDKIPSFFLHNYRHCDMKPIPIFSCSHPTACELTFPNPDYVFLSSDSKEEDISLIRAVSRAYLRGSDYGGGSALIGVPGFLSTRKICFQNQGNIWGGNAGAWVFPVEAEGAETATTGRAKADVSESPTKSLREFQVQQGILETIQATRREGICSALRQSDMCLVCIAFASWVLRSSDPEAADTWKAVLLANVSALSAIQYLRQYVKRKPADP